MASSDYKRYLRCRHWQELRQKALNRANGRCEMCGYEPWKPGTLQVHHRTYERIGKEGLDDLIVVCPRCHMKIHGIHGKRKKVTSEKRIIEREVF